ncbi:hypothetical protein ACWEQC_22150 [Streptomyces shenzhenensis]
MIEIIRVQPARHLRVQFARWAVAQRPKVRTVSESAFGVPPRLFTHMPEDLLRGSLVDGHPYVAVDYEPSAPAPEDAPELLGVATPDGIQEAVPGQLLAEIPATAYGPDAVPLPPPDFAPLEDAPVIDEEGDQLQALTDAGDTGATGRNSDSSDSAGKPYRCPQCPRDFDSERGRDTHRRMVHGR